ncbi:MAG: hypothetical protein O3C57_08445, partial [Verrucomicrobia bacterium]|nr:hypothetical protein [Verrucomicrobiota bacterium]
MAALFFFPEGVRGQNGTWTSTMSGLWGDTNNWLNGIVAGGTNNIGYFNALDVTADITVRLDAPRTIGHLVFGDANTNSPADWILDDNGVSSNILTLATSSAPTTITVAGLAPRRRATISAPLNLAYKHLDTYVAPGNVLAIRSNLTTSVAADMVELRMWGPGPCDISGEVLAPTDPGFRQFQVKGGVVNFTDTRIYTTALNVGVFTSANAYLALRNTSVDINTAGQWWGRIEVGGSGVLTSMSMLGGTLSIPNNSLSIMGYTGKRGKT